MLRLPFREYLNIGLYIFLNLLYDDFIYLNGRGENNMDTYLTDEATKITGLSLMMVQNYCVIKQVPKRGRQYFLAEEHIEELKEIKQRLDKKKVS